MADSAVINASPLILLSRAGHLGLLRHFANRILIPEAVANEIRHGGPDLSTSLVLRNTSWIETVPVIEIPRVIVQWGLGEGESSVLAYALQHDGLEAIIDDLAARRCADTLSIPVRGTLGIVLTARQRGVIPSARSVMNDLIQGGMYLSSTLLESALSRVGE